MATNRRFSVRTPLGDGALLLVRCLAQEELGAPFQLTLDLVSGIGWIDPTELLGQPMTVEIELDGGKRTLSGIVTRFAEAGGLGTRARYTAVLQPWLSLLGLAKDCRIFQERSILDVVKEVFRDFGFSDFEERLFEVYEPREYIVQYRESALAFVSRLLVEAGIYYYFRHEGERHHLVLADSVSAHDKLPGYELVPYYPPSVERARRDRDHLETLERAHEMKAGAVAVTDYDFKRPRASLLASARHPNEHAYADFEVFDYPGNYTEIGAGEALARARLEGLHAGHELYVARGNALGLGAGMVFGLVGHPRPDCNKDYLIVRARLELTTSGYESGSNVEESFQTDLTLIDAKRQHRPDATAIRQRVPGLQTAVVVGPSGEEIWTDKYGRVKVRFLWDRSQATGANSSCWVRVAQVAAGDGWGGVHIPRIGQEVLVEFLEGDPDRPVIVGRLYNGSNMPPYLLPDNKTRSGFKSRSTKGGNSENFNELRFEDKKGEEQVYLHAERDLEVLVERDEARDVGNDRRKRVAKNETVEIGESRSESVKADESISIGGNRQEQVAGDESISIGKGRRTAITTNDSLQVGEALAITVGKTLTLNVSGGQGVGIGRDHTLDVGGADSVNVAKDQAMTVGGGRTVSVAKSDSLSVGKRLSVQAEDEIALEAGSASITLKRDGTIVIKGKNVALQAAGRIEIKATGAVSIKGSKVSGN